MNKYKVGIISFSDGRKFVHEELLKMNEEFQNKLAKALESTAEIEVISPPEIVWKPSLAKKAGKFLRNQDVDVTIFNYSIWSWPHLTVLASLFAPGPFILYGHINPKFPGMVGLLASSGALDQLGIKHFKVWGDASNDEVLKKLLEYIRAISTANRLKGERYGKFGGRPMGMYTAAANGDQWMKEFGIDVEHIDQYELVLRAERVDKAKLERARKWLEEVSNVLYDGKALTPEKLEKQIALYYAAREIIEEYELDFVGFKGQPEMTNNYATMDVAEAFLNDPYDFDGEKEPIVAATETDMDGALSMEILKHMSGQPVLFADVRHIFDDGIVDLCNSGAHATYFAGKSWKAEENLKRVKFYPETFYFPAGGAAVRHFAAPGEMTFARLTRKDGKYHMIILRGEVVQMSEEEMERRAEEVQIEWPHAYVKFDFSIDEFLENYPCNHIHGVYGNYTKELVTFCKLKDIDYTVLE